MYSIKGAAKASKLVLTYRKTCFELWNERNPRAIANFKLVKAAGLQNPMNTVSINGDLGRSNLSLLSKVSRSRGVWTFLATRQRSSSTVAVASSLISKLPPVVGTTSTTISVSSTLSASSLFIFRASF